MKNANVLEVNKSAQITRILGVSLVGVISLFIFSLAMTAHADTLTRQLDQGMSGPDVSSLQTFLAQDNTIYPQGIVSGYFGPLTFSAVSNFQARNSIASVGRVGPITLAAINSQMAGGVSANAQSPSISSVYVNISRTSATVNWNTDQYAQGVVYYSTVPLTTYEQAHPIVSGNTVMSDATFRNSQSVSVQNLQPNTTYYYLIYTTNQAGNVSVTWPSTFQTTN